jgi:hypothetical protein
MDKKLAKTSMTGLWQTMKTILGCVTVFPNGQDGSLAAEAILGRCSVAPSYPESPQTRSASSPWPTFSLEIHEDDHLF